MKTATLDDLKTRLATIVGWVERGEDVMVKGKQLPEPTMPQASVDWSKSAVFRRAPDRKAVALTAEELQDFYQEIRGSH